VLANMRKLVPELYCSDLDQSLLFYCQLLGFSVQYDRPEERFAYLELSGIEIMLDEIIAEQPLTKRSWITAELEKPFGRGMNLEFEVDSADVIHEKLVSANWPIFRTVHDAWYRRGNMESGNRQFLVLDPDGYLLRPFMSLGTRDSQ